MLAVRWLHVLGMAAVVGGSALTWWSFRRVGSDETDASVGVATAVGLAATYERLFWAGMGVLVMTGVGNLGSLAPHVPMADTPWGTVFAVKLLAVMAVLALSVVRTLVVHRCQRAAAVSASDARTLRTSYAATTLALVGVVALAEVLAHG